MIQVLTGVHAARNTSLLTSSSTAERGRGVCNGGLAWVSGDSDSDERYTNWYLL